MCVMAAYAGQEPAAKVLLRMLANMEGFGGGHFAGLATIHEGKLYYAKCCGDVAELIARTDAASLPGTIGIAHSRTPGFDDDNWAHPFVSTDKTMAYTANGIVGEYAGPNYDNALRTAVARIKANGGAFYTEVSAEGKNAGIVYEGGTVIHGSDVMCGIIAEAHQQLGLPLDKAVDKALNECAEEIAGLVLSAKEPDSVTAFRINQPLVYARKKGATYLATTAFGFDEEDVSCICPMPAGSLMRLTCDGISIRALPGDLGDAATVLPYSYAARILDAAMTDCQPHHIATIADILKPVYPKGHLNESVMMAYQYVYENVKCGRLQVVKGSAKASRTGKQAPRWTFQLR